MGLNSGLFRQEQRLVGCDLPGLVLEDRLVGALGLVSDRQLERLVLGPDVDPCLPLGRSLVDKQLGRVDLEDVEVRIGESAVVPGLGDQRRRGPAGDGALQDQGDGLGAARARPVPRTVGRLLGLLSECEPGTVALVPIREDLVEGPWVCEQASQNTGLGVSNGDFAAHGRLGFGARGEGGDSLTVGCVPPSQLEGKAL